MDFPIRWSPRAASHLEQICEYISRDSKTYALISAERVLSIVESIASFPQIGRVVPEYNDPSLRERIYGNYRIVYRLKDHIVEIAAICHGAQPLEKVL
jgi:toxin ParE1/3/4